MVLSDTRVDLMQHQYWHEATNVGQSHTLEGKRQIRRANHRFDISQVLTICRTAMNRVLCLFLGLLERCGLIRCLPLRVDAFSDTCWRATNGLDVKATAGLVIKMQQTGTTLINLSIQCCGCRVISMVDASVLAIMVMATVKQKFKTIIR